MRKNGRNVGEIIAPYPDNWELDTDAVFALSYSSTSRQVRAIVNDRPVAPPVDCDLGWLDAREIIQPERHVITHEVVAVNFALTYGRLLRPSECGELLQLSSDLREIMQTSLPTSGFPD